MQRSLVEAFDKVWQLQNVQLELNSLATSVRHSPTPSTELLVHKWSPIGKCQNICPDSCHCKPWYCFQRHKHYTSCKRITLDDQLLWKSPSSPHYSCFDVTALVAYTVVVSCHVLLTWWTVWVLTCGAHCKHVWPGTQRVIYVWGLNNCIPKTLWTNINTYIH